MIFYRNGAVEGTADELKGKRIKITSTDLEHPTQTTFTRLDTNEVIGNIEEAQIVWKPGYVTRATLWLVRIDSEKCEVNHETVVCDAEIDVVALTASRSV